MAALQAQRLWPQCCAARKSSVQSLRRIIMGMFDYIHVDKHFLPEEVSHIDFKPDFQTKDFDSLMQEYFIDGERQLLKYKVEYEWIEDKKSFFGGYGKEVSRVAEKFPFFGEIEACQIYNSPDRNGVDYFLDLKLRFDSGKLVKTSVLSLQETPAAERFKKQEELKRMLANKPTLKDRFKRIVGRACWKISMFFQRLHVIVNKL